MAVTLEDVKIAIKILTQFLKTQREAQRVLAQYQRLQAKGERMPTSMQGFMEMAFQQAEARRRGVAEPEEDIDIELTEEEKERFKAMADKVKKDEGR